MRKPKKTKRDKPTPGGAPLRGPKVAGICAGLVILVFIVFGQTIRFGFIDYDDSDYISENPIVLRGLSLSNIQWAFTHVLVGHWHPLTTMVMMLDSQMFGLWAGGHHLVNVLLHSAAVVLLFLVLLEMTGGLWRSAFAAAVFAIHPLRAESVAWISECKDVLSGLFFMLALWAYVRYVKAKGRYWMILLWFALGLLSKPMVVTLPCVLLLLDYWPLKRLQTAAQFPALLREKIPLFFLSALSSFAAIIALKSGDASTSSYPANAPIAYATYIGKLFWPRNLALLYPLPLGGSPPWQVLDSIFLLAALSAAAWIWRRKEPFFITGWLWYLGMLVPVVGVMQTGNQAYADRYTYLPMIGLCFGGTWLAADWAERWRCSRAMLCAVAGVILCALVAAGWHQTNYWRSSEVLWRHSLDCTVDNFVAHDNLGNDLLRQGRAAEALSQFQQALRLASSDPEAHDDFGTALFQQGRIDEAVVQYRTSIRLKPDNAKAHNNLGDALSRQGRTADAMAEYREALRLNPDLVMTHKNLGEALFEQGHIEQGMDECRAALKIDPTSVDAKNSLAWMLITAPQQSLRDGGLALQLATSANETTGGNNPIILRTMAAACAESGDFSNAVQTAQAALRLAEAQAKPGLANALRAEIKLYEAGHRVKDVP